jgi:hypothetical protein
LGRLPPLAVIFQLYINRSNSKRVTQCHATPFFDRGGNSIFTLYSAGKSWLLVPDTSHLCDHSLFNLNPCLAFNGVQH